MHDVKNKWFLAVMMDKNGVAYLFNGPGDGRPQEVRSGVNGSQLPKLFQLLK